MMTKREVAAALEEIAALMELAGENPFKTRSYVNGARTIEALTEDLDTVVREKRLRELKGVGEALEQKIEELVTTGRLEFLENLRAQFPPTIGELFGISGLGPKRIKMLYDDLGIDSLAALEAACGENRVAPLKGFGEKLQAKILEGIAFAREHEDQFHFDIASAAAVELLAHLSGDDAVIRLELAGSLRRRKEVIKDIDILASSSNPERLMRRFTEAPAVKTVSGHGETKSSVRLESGIAADLRVVDDAEFPFALAYFTGSKEHNVVMRRRAKERGLKLNEYGLLREDGTCLTCTSEEEIFRALDLPYIPPELREDRGEFDVERIPRLIQREDLLGLIHCHTTFSDGKNSLVEMAHAARDRGYRYILITDHSQTAAYAGGLRPDRVRLQQAEIQVLNETFTGFRVLSGIESDIRADGSLDYDDDVLATFDLIIASVHSKLDMNEAEATARTIRAVENPYTDILGHPTGRLLLSRPGFPLDVEKVLDACAANGVAVEINANCRRLDLDWRHFKRGKDKGVKFSIGPDAHSITGIDNVPYGVGIARKGWLEPGDIINTMGVEELLAWRKPRP